MSAVCSFLSNNLPEPDNGGEVDELDGDVDVVSLAASDDIASSRFVRFQTPLLLFTGTGDVGIGGALVVGAPLELVALATLVAATSRNFFDTNGAAFIVGTADVGIGGGIMRNTSTAGESSYYQEEESKSDESKSESERTNDFLNFKTNRERETKEIVFR